MDIKFELKGVKELQQNVLKLAREYPRAAAAALYAEGMAVWAAAVKKTPIEYGVLRASAYVAPPTEDAGHVAVEIGYGTKYAPYVHERTELKHPRGGEAKFLEKALNERAAGFLERMGKRIEQFAREGKGVDAIPAIAPRGPTEPGGAALKSRLDKLNEHLKVEGHLVRKKRQLAAKVARARKKGRKP